MLILAIESSCDETAAALLGDGRVLRADVVRSQTELHREFGGIVPEVACRAHVEAMSAVIQRAMDDAGATFSELDAVAVTYRPGLIGSLLVGLSAAKTLAMALEVPLIGVDHLEGHLEAWRLEHEDFDYPYLGLVVSGGHTHLFACRALGERELLGATIDDAAGEAFDKAAAVLDLPYPGGPSIERAALQGDAAKYRFKRAFWHSEEVKFSFSGIKTAVLYAVKGPGKSRWHDTRPDIVTADVAAGFQEAVTDMLLDKVALAVRQTGVRRVFITGGVAANTLLRERAGRLGREAGLDIRFPGKRFCTDNAAMIAVAGWELLNAGLVSDLSLEAQPT